MSKIFPAPTVRGRFAAVCVIAGALFLIPACLEMKASTEILPRDAAFPDPGGQSPAACLRFSGEAWRRADFARAYTVSRFFSTRVKNQSGSLADLLEPALKEALRRRGYRAACPGALDLEIEAEEFALLWLPPREFIQTPVAREKGEVRLEVALTTSGGGAGAPDAKFRFEDRRSVRAAPGQEVAFLEHMTSTALNAFALEFLRFLPAADEQPR